MIVRFGDPTDCTIYGKQLFKKDHIIGYYNRLLFFATACNLVEMNLLRRYARPSNIDGAKYADLLAILKIIVSKIRDSGAFSQGVV